MQKLNTINITVLLSNKESIYIEFASNSDNDLMKQISEIEAIECGEAVVQLKEGCTYEYKLMDGFELRGSNKIIRRSKFNASMGIFSPGNYVGTLSLWVCNIANYKICGSFKIEIQSVKADYRTDYRIMLEEIAERCTELIMQHSIPVSQMFTPDQTISTRTVYQRFSFIKAIINSEEFDHALYKILQSPVTAWATEEIEKDVSRVKRLTSKQLRQFTNAAAGSRAKVSAYNKKETVDAPENRFIKHALLQFLDTITIFYSKLKNKNIYETEVSRLQVKLNHFLSHQLFKDIGTLHAVPFNSPILQRKEGYREIFRVWIMFTLAAQLTWKGGNDVYEGGKKDVAVLYEYWLFFKLHDLVTKVFNLDSPNISQLIEPTQDGLNLKLKQGSFLALEGICTTLTRKFHVQLNYNRPFSSKPKYPDPGSWTLNLRPDYTLSIWPFGLNSMEAEREELITHIHFDAKYRVDRKKGHSDSILASAGDKDLLTSGKIKKEDLAKMHTYRDAIRRTAGAYVLYPGMESMNYRSFYEVLPGIGAFGIKPSKVDNGIIELEKFLNDVVDLFVNRTSQREKMALKTYEIHKASSSIVLNTELPEPYGSNRNLLPEETAVLVGYYKSKAHLDWILSTNLYNARVKSSKGALNLDQSIMGARYLLLHNKLEKQSSKFFKLSTNGGRVFTKKELLKHKYPSIPTQQSYLIFEIDPILEIEFTKKIWDITKLKKYDSRRNHAVLFSTDLGDIMQAMIS